MSGQRPDSHGYLKLNHRRQEPSASSGYDIFKGTSQVHAV